MPQTLSEFQLLRLKSERIRALGMLIVLAVVSLIGIYHIIYTADINPGFGQIILITTLIFAAFETFFLIFIQRSIRKGRNLALQLRKVEPYVESIFPIVAMAIIMDVGDNPFTILVSPAYALILIIIAASSLRLSPRTTFYAGLLSTFCYTLLTLRVLYVDHSLGLNLNPHPERLYLELAFMILIATFVMTFITLQLNSYVEIAVKEEVMQTELKLASEIQNNLLPSPLPTFPGYEIAAFSSPATQTGGDYYDCIIPESGVAILTIGDVTGHGAGPALITASSRAYFRAIANRCNDLVRIMHQTNKLLYKDMYSGHFVTMAVLKLDVKSHHCNYLSAGHSPTLLIHNNGSVETLTAHSIPLGMDNPILFDEKDEFNLLPGDMIAMFTDGCYEVKNSKGESFNQSRLSGLLQENRHKYANEIVTILQIAIAEFLAGADQKDDMTLFLLKRTV